ncbi:hypothetical protein CKM354_001035500 [Cercospora kikuchii]|uniref:Uncharacterized protein n=1 Tax=Cercospora kikuchii TaxID=84275 RepID=A0A9P3CQV6_9PEZI|nr:uncharacterized protein CKM354_001035500 [Cercospora kikuchii]GIZ47258.1 hypothetical protein CKM354_001035500 [Cercospora kikuchii]
MVTYTILTTPRSEAATRVFGTPEMLEMILLEVTHSEVEFPADCDNYDTDDWQFVWSPIRLRAVNRDFRNTIDGSAKLLRLQLKSLPPEFAHSSRKCISGEDIGPLDWLRWSSGPHFNLHAKINNDVLELRALISGKPKSQRLVLMQDMEGSWRKICTRDSKLISRVTLTLIESETWSPHDHTQSYDLGPAPTLGMVFGMIDAAEVAIGLSLHFVSARSRWSYMGRIMP